MKFQQHQREFREGLLQHQTRRDALRKMGAGMGSIGLASLLGQQSAPAAPINPLAPKAPHFPARAKRVIQLFMPGGPSQVDTFDYKPMLAKHAGERPEVVDRKSLRNTKMGLMPSPFEFKQYGQTGKWVSDSAVSSRPRPSCESSQPRSSASERHPAATRLPERGHTGSCSIGFRSRSTTASGRMS